MNRQYEAIIFINPSITQEEINTIILKIKNILADLKGDFIEEKQPEKMKLPYKMKKCKDGYYYYIKFSLSPNMVTNFRDRIRLIEGILRITVSLIVIKIPKVKNKDENNKLAKEVQKHVEEKKEEEQSKFETDDFNEETAK